MINIKSFVTQAFIEQNTLPSNFTYGKAIYQRNAVEFIEQSSIMVEAWAGGLDGSIKEGAGSRRRVTFTIEEGALHWNCTGNPKNHQIFCKHCVAVALALQGSRPVG
jgi:uncharacterized Zn finger protein